MKVVTVTQMKAIEAETDSRGVSYAQMMERAGRGVAQAIIDWMDVVGKSIVILVGPGNNGGDGLVAGRFLAQAGASVSFYLYRPRSLDDANFALVKEIELPVELATEDKSGVALHALIKEADVIVDAVLGTGADRAITGGLKTLLERCAAAIGENRSRRTADHGGPLSPALPSFRPAALPLVVAVDCPSGLNCDTGALDPAAIPADLTVTFAAPKVGQFRFPGAAAIGELRVADIGSPDDLPALQSVLLEMATADAIREHLPPRPIDAHKGTFGKAMIVAGSVNFTGAAALAGEAAYRSGAGLVTLAVPSAIHSPLAARLAEATFLLLPHSMGVISEGAAQLLHRSLGNYDALLLGPGIGQDDETRRFLVRLLAGGETAPKGRIGFAAAAPEIEPAVEAALPRLIVDADGLNLLAQGKDWAQVLPAGTVLTPHPGEMARLLSCDREEIAGDRVGVARRAAADWGHIVVLKGAFTVVAAPDGRITVLPFANPALATAGSGDVLAGAVVAMLAMGLEPYQAAVVGAFVHGAAGQRALQEIGAWGTVAGDLPPLLAQVLADLAS